MSKQLSSKTTSSTTSSLHLSQELLKFHPNQTWPSYRSTSGMLKAARKPRISSIGASMSGASSLQSGALMLILVFSNAKTAGDGDIQPSHAKYKGQNASSAMAPINRRTIANSDGVVRQMKNWTLLDLKQRKENCAPTRSSVWIVEENIKLTLSSAPSGNIVSTENGNKRNTSRSMKTESNLFALQGAPSFISDCLKSQSIFAKCSKELAHCQRLTWDSNSIWHHIHPRTPMVRNTQNP